MSYAPRPSSFSLLAAGALLAHTSGQIRRAGQLREFSGCAVDLDLDADECVVVLDGDGTGPPSYPSGRNDDFRLQQQGSYLYLQPRHGALFSKPAPEESGFTGCRTARLTKDRSRLDGLSVGTFICARTNEGRYAELRVDEAMRKGSERILLSYKTWER